MLFRQMFDPETSTYTYLIADPVSKEAVLVDSVREQVERDYELYFCSFYCLRISNNTHGMT